MSPSSLFFACSAAAATFGVPAGYRGERVEDTAGDAPWAAMTIH